MTFKLCTTGLSKITCSLADKFELLRYRGRNTKDIQSCTTYISNDGSAIEEKIHVRDLGVTLSNDATFTQHILDRCEAVKSKIAWVLRTFKSRQRTPMLTIWKTLIMCHLDYCSQLWSPSKVGNIQSLELLQKAFINRIEGMFELSYWEQLKTLKLYSLERRPLDVCEILPLFKSSLARNWKYIFTNFHNNRPIFPDSWYKVKACVWLSAWHIFRL